MRLLVISHNVISESSGMGKTLLSYLHEFRDEEVYQLYIHSEVPVIRHVCRSYFRITDREALASRLPSGQGGYVFTDADIDEDRAFSRTDHGIVGDIYQYGRKRSPLIYLARDAMWKTSFWMNRKLRDWLDAIRPDVILLASGDYSLIYEIALKVREYCGCPLVTVCVDDYYLNYRDSDTFTGRMRHALFMRTVRKTVEHSEYLITICSDMARDYSRFFHKECRVLYTSAPDYGIKPEGNRICYIGSLGIGRDRSLLEIGRILKENENACVDVYSLEKRDSVLANLTEANGICFHGPAKPEEIGKRMQESRLIVLIESFEKEYMRRIVYSVSTKIPETLKNGPCLFAYGPKESASMRYLNENHCAFTAMDRTELASVMHSALHDETERETVLANARRIAAENHDPAVNSGRLKQWLKETAE